MSWFQKPRTGRETAGRNRPRSRSAPSQNRDSRLALSHPADIRTASGSTIPCRHQWQDGRRARDREPDRRTGRENAASRSCLRQRSTQGQNRRSRLAQSHPSNIRTQVSRFCRKGRQGSTQRCFNLTSIASLPQSLDPRVIIFHAEADKSWSILMHRRLGKFKHQRISGIQGYVDLTAKDKIPVICSVSIGGV